MKNHLLRGETATIRVDMPSGLTGAPKWTLYDADDDVIVFGNATSETATRWAASVTVPANVPIPDGEADWRIVFDATTTGGRDISKEKALTILDTRENWRSFGILYHSGQTTIYDFALLDREATTIHMLLRDGYDEGNLNIAEVSIDPPTVTSLNTRGYGYDLSLTVDPTKLSANSAGIYPYQLIVTSTFDSGPPDIYAKPVYVLTPTVLTQVIALRRYLDKARIDELDQNLAFSDEELIHFLLQGAQYINGIKELTYYSIAKFPMPLEKYLHIAAAWEALNARFLAEGMNAFEFSGSNTSLSFNRRDVIQVKMDELRGILDQYLPSAKTAAVRTFGLGTPPPGMTNTKTTKTIGMVGIAYSPVTNRTAYPIYGRRADSNYRY